MFLYISLSFLFYEKSYLLVGNYFFNFFNTVENLLMKFTFWLKENIIFICKKMFSNLKD